MISPVNSTTVIPATSIQEKPVDNQGTPETSPAQAYYDSIIRPDIDTSSMTKVDEVQMQTNQNVSDILSRHIKNYDGWIDFNVHSNMMLDPFLKNFPKEWMESAPIHAKWMDFRSSILQIVNQAIVQGKISNE